MLALLIITFGIFSRVILHAPNFTPVLALALFGGMYLKGRQAFWVPLVLMVASDLIVGFHNTMFFTWGSIFVISLMGIWLRQHKSFLNVTFTSVAASIFFFIVTNLAAWPTLYPLTWVGLQECFIAAIPFYRSTLVSTLAYSLVLFSLWELLLSRRENPLLSKVL